MSEDYGKSAIFLHATMVIGVLFKQHLVGLLYTKLKQVIIFLRGLNCTTAGSGSCNGAMQFYQWDMKFQGSQPKMVKNPENTGGQKLATGGLCRGCGGEAPSRRRQRGVGAEPPATENVCIFYLKKKNF